MDRKEPFALSDAIRIGAAIRPQAFHTLFVDGRSCALGAAVEATTSVFLDPVTADDYKRLDEVWDVLMLRFEKMFEQCVECPACLAFGREEFDDLIVHLNDTHRWTREQIADFVAQVEEQIGYVTLTEESLSSSVSLVSAGV